MKLKIKDILIEDCGCVYTVIGIGKTEYRLRHRDGDTLKWNKRQIHSFLKTGQLRQLRMVRRQTLRNMGDQK